MHSIPEMQFYSLFAANKFGRSPFFITPHFYAIMSDFSFVIPHTNGSLFTYRFSSATIYSPIRWHSSDIDPAMCGVRMTFSNVNNGECATGGSGYVTSNTANRSCRCFNTSIISGSLITAPLDVLIRVAFVFILLIKSPVINPSVSFNHGVCRDTTSAASKTSSREQSFTPNFAAASSDTYGS